MSGVAKVTACGNQQQKKTAPGTKTHRWCIYENTAVSANRLSKLRTFPYKETRKALLSVNQRNVGSVPLSLCTDV